MNVVSFYAPRPDHPFFQDYRPFLSLLRASCERFGHNHLVLTDDPMEIGHDDAYVVDLPRSLMKAVLAAQFAYLSDPNMANVPTLFVGADCVLANNPVAFAEHDCDMAITIGDFADCRMNTGAIYIPKPCQVAEIWGNALAKVGDEWGDDQTSLYRAIQLRPWHGVWTARVCELPVDPYNLAPENPSDDCRRGVVLHFRGPRKRWMIDYCHKWLRIGEGIKVTLRPNTDEALMLDNVRVNIGRSIPQLQAAEPHDGHAVLVGGGPSVANDLDEIRWRAEQGQVIFALNGAARWLLDRGVVADYGVILDPRASNAKFISAVRNGWLLASQCDPAVFEAATGETAEMWHFLTPGIEKIAPGPLIGGGLTVGLSAMAVVFTMGYRNLHLYGYDSSDAEGASHAYSQSENALESHRVEVWVDGRRFVAAAAMYAQAEAFQRWAETLIEAGALITVHGDGLLPTIARCMAGATALSGEIEHA